MIFVDPRFGETKTRSGKERLDAFVADVTALGVPAEPSMLDSGDFMFLGNGPDGPIKIGLELKLVPDFVSSIQSGHLSDQLTRMFDDYQRVYLIVEGFYRIGRKSGLLEIPAGRRWRPLAFGRRPTFWQDVERYVASIEEAGVRVHRTRTPHETARVLARVLYPFWDKPYDEHRSLDVLYQPPALSVRREDETTARIRRVAVALKAGVGIERSKAVAQAVGSVFRLALAGEDELAKIEGIGIGIAGDIVRAIRATVPTVSPPSRRVPQRARPARRGPRDSRQRESRRLDASRPAQRRVSAARTSR